MKKKKTSKKIATNSMSDVSRLLENSKRIDETLVTLNFLLSRHSAITGLLLGGIATRVGPIRVRQ